MARTAIRIGLFLILLACASVLVPSSEGDVATVSDGEFAYILDEEDSTATVTDIVSDPVYQTMDVPDRVEYNGKEYTVDSVSMGKNWNKVRTVTLPDTVSSVSLGGGTASNLEAFELRGDSPYFTEYGGCLYSADGKTLKVVPWGYAGLFMMQDGTEAADRDALSGLSRVTSILFPASFADSDLRIEDDPELGHISFSPLMNGEGLVLGAESLSSFTFRGLLFEIEGITLDTIEGNEDVEGRMFISSGDGVFVEYVMGSSYDYFAWAIVFIAVAVMATVLFLAFRRTKGSEPDPLGPLDEKDDEDGASDYRRHHSHGDADEDLRHAIGADQDESPYRRRARYQVSHVGSDEYPRDVRRHQAHEPDRPGESHHGGGHHSDDEEGHRADASDLDTEAGGAPVPACHDPDVPRQELQQDHGHQHHACDDPHIVP